jgi:hypothetical protein
MLVHASVFVRVVMCWKRLSPLFETRLLPQDRRRWIAGGGHGLAVAATAAFHLAGHGSCSPRLAPVKPAHSICFPPLLHRGLYLYSNTGCYLAQTVEQARRREGNSQAIVVK